MWQARARREPLALEQLAPARPERRACRAEAERKESRALRAPRGLELREPAARRRLVFRETIQYVVARRLDN